MLIKKSCIKISDKRVIVNQKIVAATTTGPLMPGEYEFPFTIILPRGLPGSYFHSSGRGNSKTFCKVSYSLTSEIVQNRVTNDSPVIGRTMCPMFIMQRERKIPRNNEVWFIHNKIKTWLFCNRGEAKTSVVLEKDSVSMSEIIGLSIATNWLESKNSVKDVMIALKRTISLMTMEGEK